MPGGAAVLRAEQEAAVAFHAGRHRLEPQGGEEVGELGVPLAEVGRAGVDPLARRHLDAVGPAADALAGLEDDHLGPTPDEIVRRGESGESGTDDEDPHARWLSTCVARAPG